MTLVTLIMITGCQIPDPDDSDCDLYYNDTLELRIGEGVYSCDSAWFCLDSIVSDTRNLIDSTGELVVALSYRIQGTDYHRQFSTADTWVESQNFTGYQFLLINAYAENSPGSDHYLNVYDIYPDQAVNIALYDNIFRLFCVFVRDIEG